ncbi:hypothetical protein Fot_05060 [Forsythia ovata]|uniref:Uncharacterized protein n=1 Tax=Forsythia ovata TaxID=205694 RepID=A0ABD1WP27_9LAMI
MQKNIRQSYQKGSTVTSTASSQNMVRSGSSAPIYILWFAVVVTGMLSTWKSPNRCCFLYDPDRICSTDDQIRVYLKPMTKILPMLLKKINIVFDALAIERITTTSKVSNSVAIRHFLVIKETFGNKDKFVLEIQTTKNASLQRSTQKAEV